MLLKNQKQKFKDFSILQTDDSNHSLPGDELGILKTAGSNKRSLALLANRQLAQTQYCLVGPKSRKLNNSSYFSSSSTSLCGVLDSPVINDISLLSSDSLPEVSHQMDGSIDSDDVECRDDVNSTGQDLFGENDLRSFLLLSSNPNQIEMEDPIPTNSGRTNKQQRLHHPRFVSRPFKQPYSKRSSNYNLGGTKYSGRSNMLRSFANSVIEVCRPRPEIQFSSSINQRIDEDWVAAASLVAEQQDQANNNHSLQTVSESNSHNLDYDNLSNSLTFDERDLVSVARSLLSTDNSNHHHHHRVDDKLKLDVDNDDLGDKHMTSGPSCSTSSSSKLETDVEDVGPSLDLDVFLA